MADNDIPWYKSYTGKTPQGRVNPPNTLFLPSSPNSNISQLGDGREQQLLTHVQSDTSNTPTSVAHSIDTFGIKKSYLMTIGPRKAHLLRNIIFNHRPGIMVELGGYIGYSAGALGSAVKEAGGQRYISVESNETFASIAREMIEMAGLEGFVEVRVGKSDLVLRELKEEIGGKLDVLFVDHYKPAYLHDLLLCEELGLVGKDTWVAADNVRHPGAPEYKAYVLSTVEEKIARVARGEKEMNPNGQNWYLGTEQKGVKFEFVVGRPELQYQTECIETFEPDGTPVSDQAWVRGLVVLMT